VRLVERTLPEDPSELLAEHAQELDGAWRALSDGLIAGSEVHVDADGRLHADKIDAIADPPSPCRLRGACRPCRSAPGSIRAAGQGRFRLIAAEQEFFDRVWHERHLVGRYKHESNEELMTDEIYKMALDAAERVRSRRSGIGPVESDFEWGMWNGKLSTLRWVLGEEWDLLES